MSFIDQVILNKKVMIKVDDYVPFHKMHRWAEFNEISHYLCLYFYYHYIPYWRNNVQPNIDRMIDSDIKILALWEGSYGMNPSCVTQLEDIIAISNMTTEDLDQYDVILNMSDSEIGTRSNHKAGLESKIASGQIKLRPDQIYLGFKSSRAPEHNYSFYQMKLAQSYSQNIEVKEPLILKDMTGNNAHHNSRIQYGPWPLDYLDIETFTPWKTKE